MIPTAAVPLAVAGATMVSFIADKLFSL